MAQAEKAQGRNRRWSHSNLEPPSRTQSIFTFSTKRLRLLVMDALERIEIALRVDISQHWANRIRSLTWTPPCSTSDFANSLDRDSGLSRHHEWLGKHAQLIGRSKGEFVRQQEQYGPPLAIWVACEVWDFGTMSHTLRRHARHGTGHHRRPVWRQQRPASSPPGCAASITCATSAPTTAAWELQHRGVNRVCLAARKYLLGQTVRAERPCPCPLFHAAAHYPPSDAVH